MLNRTATIGLTVLAALSLGACGGSSGDDGIDAGTVVTITEEVTATDSTSTGETTTTTTTTTTEDGAPQFVCANDSTLGGGETLPYGQSIAAGLLRCESAATGMTCTDTETGRGFTLAKEAYELF